jgi:hypothetical protein
MAPKSGVWRQRGLNGPDSVDVMKIEIDEEIEIDASTERAFAYATDIANLSSFVGYGPIPGIVSATYVSGRAAALGTARQIVNADGTTHDEVYIEFDSPRRYLVEIKGLQPPFSLLVKSARDEFVFVPGRGGTEIRRKFTFFLAGLAAYPAAAALVPFMRRAIRLNLVNIKAGLERRQSVLDASTPPPIA